MTPPQRVDVRMRECVSCGQAAPEGVAIVHDRGCVATCAACGKVVQDPLCITLAGNRIHGGCYIDALKELRRRPATAALLADDGMTWSKAKSKPGLRRLYLSLIPRLRRVARESGYALGVHGSLTRDLDIIAVPWTRTAVLPDTLAQRISVEAVGFRQAICWERKPHGRQAAAIMVGMRAYVDLSVTPFLTKRKR